MRRIMLGISQEKLGDALGITFQQVQKYEKGTNRISASRLQHISHVLQVPIPFFFEGLPSGSGKANKLPDAPFPSYVSDFLATSDGLSLTRAYTQITNQKLRRSIVHLVEGLARDVD
jgi:transcriptional regulator with XRE-family HTH domain